MKHILHSISKDRTFRANVVMVGGSFLANVGAYLYHLLMGRLLVPDDYGALQSLISLSNIFTVPLLTLNVVVTKFVASFVGRGEPEKISYLFHRLQKILLVVVFLGGFIFFVFSGTILTFLHIESWVNFLFLDIVLFFGLIATLNRATLQGLSNFVSLTVAQFIEAYGKLLLGFVAVTLGFRVTGAFGAFVLIAFVSYIYTAYVLKPYVSKKEKSTSVSIRSMGKYGLLSFFMTISMVSLYNTDVVLVRHFFSSYESGLYAALSVLGKIIFFGSAPVSVAMFPLVAEAHARGEKYHKIFLKSMLLILGIAGVATFLFSVYPTIALKILVGEKYLSAAPYLPAFSVFLSLCAVIYLLVNFFLSIQKVLPAYIIGAAAIAQIVLISLVHPNLSVVILISLSILSVLTVVFMTYYVAIAKS